MDGFQSLMKSILDSLLPEPRPKMWQKFDIEFIVHKEFVPPGKTVNGRFCFDILRRVRENTGRKRPYKWRDKSWAQYHDKSSGSSVARCATIFGLYENDSDLPTSIITGPHQPVFFYFLSPKIKLKLKKNVLTALKRRRTTRRT